jgi:polyketide synthase PksN
MLEAHGTGTKLGDPVEYQALTRAFGKDTEKRGFCALGSIKTNLGHTAMAAGVAGVLKILLSLQHKQIPPSLHYEKTNAHIDFENSPFYVNTQLREWSVEEGEKRCAAVSSFGFSGTNAHMVIEEGPRERRVHRERPGYLIVLSARTAEQLRQQVEQLEEYGRKIQLDCGNASYTLLLGRRHFSHRLACLARSGEELGRLLRTWLEKGEAPQVYVSPAEPERREQSGLKQYAEQCFDVCRESTDPGVFLERLAALAELYVHGYSLDFNRLFAWGEYSRMSLPTYPFARERYWVPENGAAAGAGNRGEKERGAGGWLHPLLQRNSSSLAGQRYRTRLEGSEFYLEDHRVKGARVLPAVAYLEMAQAGVREGLELGAGEGIRLKDVVWMRPVVVGAGGVELELELRVEESGELEFEISSVEGVGSGRVVHAQGKAEAGSGEGEGGQVDIEGLERGCEERLEVGWCYETFRKLGLEYGASHRGLEAVGVGRAESGERYVVGRVKLPEGVEREGYGMHPAVMDAAVQACLGLREAEAGEGQGAELPFGVEQVEMYGVSPERAVVWIRKAADSTARVRKLDVDVCDEGGRVRVALRGLSSRPLEGENGAARRTGLYTLAAVWEPREVKPREAWPTAAEAVLIVGGGAEQRQKLQKRYPGAPEWSLNGAGESIGELVERLKQGGPLDHVIWMAEPAAEQKEEERDSGENERAWLEAIGQAQRRGVENCFRMIKALLECGYGERELGFTVVTEQSQQTEGERVEVAHAGVHGLVGSLAQEYPEWKVRLVDVEAGAEWPWEELLGLEAGRVEKGATSRGGAERVAGGRKWDRVPAGRSVCGDWGSRRNRAGI